MFSASEMNQALVKAFNISVCYNNIINTNLKVQNVHRGLRNKDHIVISFDKSMDADQCMKYLDNMKGRIVETFCGNESTASLSFDMKSFPFNFNRSQLVDSNGKYRFSVPIDQSIVFNLKCLLANGLARDITGAMGRNFGLEHVEEYTSDESFDRKSYLYCMRFYDKRLQEYFIESFSATVKGYKNSPKRTDDFLKVKDNCVYIKKSLFDKTKFINEIEESQACLIGRDLQTSSSDDPAIEKIKYLITGFIRKACPPLYYVFHTSYSGNNEDSILVPIVSYDSYYRFLTKEEVDTINSSFGMVVLNNIESYTSPKHLPVFGSRGIYGIDFSNKEISHCVITKIIKNSVINKDHELAIDPELPRTLLAEASPTQEFPKRSRGEELEKHPRRRSKKEEETGRVLREGIGQASTSSQQTDDMPRRSYTSRYRRTPLMSQPSTLRELSLSKGADESMLIEIRGQQVRYRPSLTSPPIAWDDSTFLNLEVSNEESEKQQVTDESDRKSSDEYSDAKSQESESPEKKHGGGWRCSKRKSDGVTSLFRQNNKGRGSVYSISSSVSAPGGPVSKKSSVSKLFSSFPVRIRARSNPSSVVTSPTHKGVPEWQQRLNPDQREELCKVLPPEMKEKLNSNSFSPGKEQHLYLTHTLSGKRELSRSLCESQELQLRRLAEAQLSSPDNSSSKRDSGYSSGSPASPAVPHNGSVPSELKHPQQVKHTSEALGK